MWETWVGKNCSRLLILNMKIKIAVRCHLLPTRLKKPYCVKCWKDPKDSLLNCLLKVYSFAFYIEVLIYLELLWGKWESLNSVFFNMNICFSKFYSVAFLPLVIWNDSFVINQSPYVHEYVSLFLSRSCFYLSLPEYVGFPGGWNGKESTCQCSKLMFDSWVRKIPCGRKWQFTPVFLPGKSQGQRSLVG